jgi:hypothetical protein
VSLKKRSGKSGGTRTLRKASAPSDGKASAPSDGKASAPSDGKPSAPAEGTPSPALVLEAAAAPRKPLKISTVSHTLETTVAERLRHFAFHERVSESAVIEYALREFFRTGDDAALGHRLREAGAALRRKP